MLSAGVFARAPFGLFILSELCLGYSLKRTEPYITLQASQQRSTGQGNIPKGVPIKTSALGEVPHEPSVCYVFMERERDDVGIFPCPVRTTDYFVKGNMLLAGGCLTLHNRNYKMKTVIKTINRTMLEVWWNGDLDSYVCLKNKIKET